MGKRQVVQERENHLQTTKKSQASPVKPTKKHLSNIVKSSKPNSSVSSFNNNNNNATPSLLYFGSSNNNNDLLLLIPPSLLFFLLLLHVPRPSKLLSSSSKKLLFLRKLLRFSTKAPNLRSLTKKSLDIIQETEKAARSLETKGQPEKGEKLRQDVSSILHTASQNPRRHTSNLTTTEKKGLKILKQKIKDNEIAITPHDKGLGFVTLDPQSLKDKATAAFQNVTANTPDRTKTLEGSIQRKTLKLKKEGKISEKDYKQMYPSGCIAPASYPLLKAHKPAKHYPARNIISHRGCPQEGLASFLIPIIRALLKDSPYACKNSHEFIKFTKDVKLRADEILASFDATALFPSIPLQKCIEVIKQLLLNDPTLSSRTSLTPDDIISLIQLCLSTSDFIYDGVHHTASQSGPIGLSLMVVIAEI